MPPSWARDRIGQDATRLPRDGHLARRRLEAGQRAQEFALPVALDAGKADDLAGPYGARSTPCRM